MNDEITKQNNVLSRTKHYTLLSPGYSLENPQEPQQIRSGGQYACLLPGEDAYRFYTAYSVLHAFAIDGCIAEGDSLESYARRNREAGGSDYTFFAEPHPASVAHGYRFHRHYTTVQLGKPVLMEGRRFLVVVKPDRNLHLVELDGLDVL